MVAALAAGAARELAGCRAILSFLDGAAAAAAALLPGALSRAAAGRLFQGAACQEGGSAAHLQCGGDGRLNGRLARLRPGRGFCRHAGDRRHPQKQTEFRSHPLRIEERSRMVERRARHHHDGKARGRGDDAWLERPRPDPRASERQAGSGTSATGCLGQAARPADCRWRKRRGADRRAGSFEGQGKQQRIPHRGMGRNLFEAHRRDDRGDERPRHSGHLGRSADYPRTESHQRRRLSQRSLSRTGRKSGRHLCGRVGRLCRRGWQIRIIRSGRRRPDTPIALARRRLFHQIRRTQACSLCRAGNPPRDFHARGACGIAGGQRGAAFRDAASGRAHRTADCGRRFAVDLRHGFRRRRIAGRREHAPFCV